MAITVLDNSTLDLSIIVNNSSSASERTAASEGISAWFVDPGFAFFEFPTFKTSNAHDISFSVSSYAQIRESLLIRPFIKIGSNFRPQEIGFGSGSGSIDRTATPILY